MTSPATALILSSLLATPLTALAQTGYFAEGVTGTFFDTRIVLFSANDWGDTHVQLRFLLEGGGEVSTTVTVPANTRRTIQVDEVPGMAAASFSTIVGSDRPIAAARTVTWGEGRAYGAHAQTATYPSSRWYCAEGATHGPFDTFFLILNPSAAETAHVTASFLTGAGTPIAHAYDVPPNGRLTIQADRIVGLEAAEFGAVFTTAEQTPVVVERSMYLSRPEQPWAGGHATYCAPDLPRQSYFAEGATGSFFDTFMLVANPAASAASVRMRYVTMGGVEIERSHVVPASGRLTINVANEAPELADTLFSTTVETTAGDNVVAERTMWWPAGAWYEGHVSSGSGRTLTSATIADAEVGGPSNAQTYLIVATGLTGGPVRVTFYPEGGPPPSTAPGWPGRIYYLNADRRYTINVGAEFPELTGQRFAIELQSLMSVPSSIPRPLAQFVAEASVYRDADGVIWRSGASLP